MNRIPPPYCSPAATDEQCAEPFVAALSHRRVADTLNGKTNLGAASLAIFKGADVLLVFGVASSSRRFFLLPKTNPYDLAQLDSI